MNKFFSLMVLVVFSLFVFIVSSASAIRVHYTDWQEIHVGEQAILPLTVDGEGAKLVSWSATLDFDTNGLDFISAASKEFKVWTYRCWSGDQVMLFAWAPKSTAVYGGTVSLTFQSKDEGYYIVFAKNVRVNGRSYSPEYPGELEGLIRVWPNIIVVSSMTDEEWNSGEWHNYSLSPGQQHDFYLSTVELPDHRVAVASFSWVPFGPEEETDTYGGATFANGAFYSVTVRIEGYTVQARLGDPVFEDIFDILVSWIDEWIYEQYIDFKILDIWVGMKENYQTQFK